MPTDNRADFFTLIMVHLADVQARQEVTMQLLSALAAGLTPGKSSDAWLAEMQKRYKSARKSHEMTMLADLRKLRQAAVKRDPWPAQPDKN